LAKIEKDFILFFIFPEISSPPQLFIFSIKTIYVNVPSINKGGNASEDGAI
jgi:hypothetical protein